jgi:hypothetical protein
MIVARSTMWHFNSLEKRSRQWHEQIQRLTWGGFPSPGSVKMEFCLSYPCPFVNEIQPLQQCTDDYLVKFGRLSDIDRDTKLNALIRGAEHELSAFLACCHRLSVSEILLWISTISRKAMSSSQTHTYLDIILAISDLNASFLRRTEAQTAGNLKVLIDFNDKYPEMEYTSHNAPGSHTVMVAATKAFQAAKEVIVELSSGRKNIWPEALKGIVKTFYACLQDTMVQLRSPNLWDLAISYVKPMVIDAKWAHLVRFCDPTDPYQPGSLHLAWQHWNPDPAHLDIVTWMPSPWRDMPTFRNLFVLVGPDFEMGRYPTFLERHIREAVIPNFVCVEKVGILAKPNFGVELRTVVHKLLEVIERAARQPVSIDGSRPQLELIQCMLAEGIVNENHVQILDAIIGNNSISAEAMQIYHHFLTNGSSSLSNAGLPESKPKAALLREMLGTLHTPAFFLVKESVGVLAGDIIARELNAQFSSLRSHLWSQGSLSLDRFAECLEYISLLKGDGWLRNLVEASTRSTALAMPEAERINSILTFQSHVHSQVQEEAELHRVITAYAECLLFGSSTYEVSDSEMDLATALYKVTTDNGPEMRLVAFRVGGWTHITMGDRVFIISTIHKTKTSQIFAERLESATRSDLACVKLARLLCLGGVENISAWCRMLEIMIAPLSETIYETTTLNLDLTAWINWLNDIRTLFTPNNMTILATGLRHKWLHEWTKRLETRQFYFSKLSAIFGRTGPGMKKIYASFERPESMLRLLDQIAKCNEKNYAACRFLFIRMPLTNTREMKELYKILRFLGRSPETDNPVLLKLRSIFELSDHELMYGMLLVWSQSSLNSKSLNGWPEKETFTDVLQSVNLTADERRACIQSVSEHIASRYDDFRSRVSGLRCIRTNLKLHDSEKTTVFLKSLGMKDQGGMFYIPAHLTDFVDEVKPRIFDLYFPLDNLKPVQRLALGVEEARNLVVRVELLNGLGRPVFKVRLDLNNSNNRKATSKAEGEDHEPIFLKVTAFMTAKEQDKALFAVGRILWHHFASGVDDIEDIYSVVWEYLENMNRCAVCLAELHVKFVCFTTCQKTACVNSEVWGRMKLLEMNPKVLDLFLLSAMSVTIIGNTRLLPLCPTSISEPVQLRYLMDSVPDTSSLRSALTVPTPALESTQVYTLLKYLASFRVFITEATGLLRIPSLPGVHQFVIWNSTPEVEGLRAKWFGRDRREGGSQVVFHGTSFDRLFPILSEGLKALSGTQWQSNGATYGSGIYCSPDLSLALWYATKGHKWQNTMIGDGYRLVLSCELAGNARQVTADGRIMVVDDATQLSARYLLLFPATATAPESRFVEPAMKSAFGLIRAGST